MKDSTTLLTVTLLFCSQLLTAQSAPAIQWQKSFGGTNDDEALSVHQTTAGGYIVAGYTTSTNGDVTFNHGMEDYWVLKLDSKGNIDWQKTYGGSNTDIAYCIQQTKEGGYIVAGWSYSNDGDVTKNHGLGDYWIVKLDTAGNITWQKSFGGSDDDWAEYIQQTTDGGYIISGRSKSSNGNATLNHGVSDFWIVKLDSVGNLTWQKSLGGSEYDDATSVRQTDDGGYIAAGWSKSTDGDVTGNHGDDDYWVTKLDASGNLLWEKSYGGSSYDQPYCIRQTTDHGFIIAGFTGSYNGDVHGNNGDHDYWVVKLDTNQQITWAKCYGGTAIERGKCVEQTVDGGYIIAGWANSNNGDVSGNHGDDDYWIVKIDADGNLLWQKSLADPVLMNVILSSQLPTEDILLPAGLNQTAVMLQETTAILITGS